MPPESICEAPDILVRWIQDLHAPHPPPHPPPDNGLHAPPPPSPSPTRQWPACPPTPLPVPHQSMACMPPHPSPRPPPVNGLHAPPPPSPSPTSQWPACPPTPLPVPHQSMACMALRSLSASSAASCISFCRAVSHSRRLRQRSSRAPLGGGAGGRVRQAALEEGIAGVRESGFRVEESSAQAGCGAEGVTKGRGGA